MVSSVHTPWFQYSNFANKTFFGVSITFISTNSSNSYISAKMECFEELKCAASASPDKNNFHGLLIVAHFNSSEHSILRAMVSVVASCVSDTYTKTKEERLIYEVGTLEPRGMNVRFHYFPVSIVTPQLYKQHIYFSKYYFCHVFRYNVMHSNVIFEITLPMLKTTHVLLRVRARVIYLIIALPLLLYTQVFLRVQFLDQYFSPCILSLCLPLLTHTLTYTIHLLITYNYRCLLPRYNILATSLYTVMCM